MEDGKVICEDKSIDTFEKAIKELFPDLIIEMGLKLNGQELITTERKYVSQRDLKNGYFLSTLSEVPKKVKILKEIAANLGVKISVEIIEC